MDPSIAEAQGILRYYEVTYDEVIFYEYHHQIGKYVSRPDKTQEWEVTDASVSHIVASRRYHDDAMGSYHDHVSLA